MRIIGIHPRISCGSNYGLTRTDKGRNDGSVFQNERYEEWIITSGVEGAGFNQGLRGSLGSGCDGGEPMGRSPIPTLEADTW